MWHRTRTNAVLGAMRLVDRRVDPDELMRKAKDAGITLPIVCQNVSAASLGGQALGYQVPYDRLPEFRQAIDAIMAGTKRAA